MKEIGVDAGATLAAKERSDALKTAWQTSAPLTQEFTEQMINSYINDPNSPRHFDYPPESAGNFGSRITKYQIELGDNQATAIAVGVIQVGSFSKRVIVRATGSLVGGPAARQIKLSSMFIGKLPLQSLPLGQKLMDLCAGSLFRFQFFDSEWKILKGAADVRLGGGKLVVTVGPAAAAAGS